MQPPMSNRITVGQDAAVADPEEFVFAMINWGEHFHDAPRGWSIEEARARVPGFAAIVEEVRNGAPVKYFENLLGATWRTDSSAGANSSVKVRNAATGEEYDSKGPGILQLNTYVAIFETAVNAWHRAVQNEAPAELLTAIRDGIASIEAFVNRQAAEWNVAHPHDMFKDKSPRFTSFRTKWKIGVRK